MSPDPAPSATSSAVPSHGTGLPLAGPLCPLSLPVTHKPSGAPHLLKMGSPHIYLALARAQHFLPSSSAQALSGPTSPLTVFMPPSPGACPDLSLFQFWRWISLAWVPRSHLSITTRDQGSAGSGDGGQETEARSHQARRQHQKSVLGPESRGPMLGFWQGRLESHYAPSGRCMERGEAWQATPQGAVGPQQHLQAGLRPGAGRMAHSALGL